VEGVQPVSKAGSKLSQLPVTDPAPVLCPDLLSALPMPGMLPVQGPYPPFKVIGWLDEEAARDLIRQGKVYTFHTKKRIRALRYIPRKDAEEIEQQVPVHSPGLGAPHQNETDRNPPGVWTFEYLPQWSLKVFRSVIDSCKKAA
jgi:hypothetical protein